MSESLVQSFFNSLVASVAPFNLSSNAEISEPTKQEMVTLSDIVYGWSWRQLR